MSLQRPPAAKSPPQDGASQAGAAWSGCRETWIGLTYKVSNIRIHHQWPIDSLLVIPANKAVLTLGSCFGLATPLVCFFLQILLYHWISSITILTWSHLSLSWHRRTSSFHLNVCVSVALYECLGSRLHTCSWSWALLTSSMVRSRNWRDQEGWQVPAKGMVFMCLWVAGQPAAIGALCHMPGQWLAQAVLLLKCLNVSVCSYANVINSQWVLFLYLLQRRGG